MRGIIISLTIFLVKTFKLNDEFIKDWHQVINLSVTSNKLGMKIKETQCAIKALSK